MPVTETTGHFTFADWKENPVSPEDAFPRLAHATVVNAFSGGIEAEATVCDYAIAYDTAATGAFAGMELVTGRVDGRSGTFVLEERGRFESDGTVHCTFAVAEGSGTGGAGRAARFGRVHLPARRDEGAVHLRVRGEARLNHVRGSVKPALCTVDRASRAARALPP